MREYTYTIKENSLLAPGVHRLVLAGKPGDIRPGQFMEVKIPGSFLRRPFSVCDATEDSLTAVYKETGSGTRALGNLLPEACLSVLTGLGNGYSLTEAGEYPLLVGGGTGASPMYGLAKALCGEGKQVTVVLGFNTAEEAFLTEEFRALGCAVRVTTVDGSLGQKGFVTDALPESCSFLYACGPEPMLKTLAAKVQAPGEFSLEKRMGCGFGACMGCTIQTAEGQKRVCKDGPVFRKEVLLWED